MVLFGPPGSGKGTQAKLLRDRLQVTHFSSGDLFRRHLHDQTPLGLRAEEFMTQGLLVPDEVTIDMFLEKVLSLPAEAGFILDGFPRNPNQAKALEEALKRQSRGLNRVVHLNVTEPELLRRLGGRFSCRQCLAPHNIELPASEQGSKEISGSNEPSCQKCGGELSQRTDDRPEVVRRRIEVYGEETKPVLEFYRERGLLAEVPGTGSVETVKQLVWAALTPK